MLPFKESISPVSLTQNSSTSQILTECWDGMTYPNSPCLFSPKKGSYSIAIISIGTKAALRRSHSAECRVWEWTGLFFRFELLFTRLCRPSNKISDHGGLPDGRCRSYAIPPVSRTAEHSLTAIKVWKPLLQLSGNLTPSGPGYSSLSWIGREFPVFCFTQNT